MAESPTASLKALARELRSLEIDHAFTGGSIVALLLDNPSLTPIRPTDDVDVIVEVLSRKEYPKFEERLRERGFQNDTRQGAPICRWIFNTLTVDLMPIDGEFLGLNTIWFDHALSSAIEVSVDGEIIRVVSATGLIATKLAAFRDRGEGDYFGSRDIEDLIAVIDGRKRIVEDIDESPKEMRRYIISELATYMAKGLFREAIAGHLASDSGSQARLPGMIEKLERITMLVCASER